MDETQQKKDGAIPRGKITFEETELNSVEKGTSEESLVEQLSTESERTATQVGIEEKVFDEENYGSAVVRPIRTFARDLEEAKKRSGKEGARDTEQKGGKPPPKESPTIPDEALLEGIDGISTSVRGEFVPQQPIEIEKKVPSKQPPPQELLQDQARAFEEQLKESSLERPEPKSKQTDTVSPIHTYKYDAAKSIAGKNLSAVSIAAAESNRRAREPRYRPRPPQDSTFTKNFAIVVLSVVLISSGLGIGWFFFIKANENTGITPRTGIPSLIFADQQKEVSLAGLSNNQLLAKLDSERINTKAASNVIVHLYLTEAGSILPADMLLARLSSNVPSLLTRSVLSEFMFGVHTKDGNKPFLIFKTSDFEQTFAGMLEWENTLNRDLAPLFGPVLSVGTSQLKDASGIVIPRIFHDIVVRNVDTRLLRDDSGNVVLFYAFPNPETVVITNNENTFFEIFRRLSTSRGRSN